MGKYLLMRVNTIQFVSYLFVLFGILLLHGYLFIELKNLDSEKHWHRYERCVWNLFEWLNWSWFLSVTTSLRRFAGLWILRGSLFGTRMRDLERVRPIRDCLDFLNPSPFLGWLSVLPNFVKNIYFVCVLLAIIIFGVTVSYAAIMLFHHYYVIISACFYLISFLVHAIIITFSQNYCWFMFSIFYWLRIPGIC